MPGRARSHDVCGVSTVEPPISSQNAVLVEHDKSWTANLPLVKDRITIGCATFQTGSSRLARRCVSRRP